MSNCDSPESVITQTNTLSINPPFIWPDCRILAGVSHYAEPPCNNVLFTNADLISGVIVGANNGTIELIEKYLTSSDKVKLVFVLVLYPAGPTRAKHLQRIRALLAANDGGAAKAEIRLITMEHHYVDESEHIKLPPTVIQAHDTKTGQTVMSIGSVADAGYDQFDLGTLNLVFHPDDGVRDEWRRWFQYLVEVSVQLTSETCDIPYLVPAKGDQQATRMWESYKASFTPKTIDEKTEDKPQVNPLTGEIVKSPTGISVDPWDGGATALDPLASVLQKLYADAWLVTVDETTRLKPVRIPVKATLLGQQSEHIIGSVTQKQSFALQVLDDTVEKEVEKCRKIGDLIDLLTFPLSQGNHLLPNRAKVLLEKEVPARDTRGKKALWNVFIDQQDKPAVEKDILIALRNSGFGGHIDALCKQFENDSVTLDSDSRIIQSIIDSDKEENATLKALLIKEHVLRIIDLKRNSITKDLNQMYHKLGQGDCVPADKLKAVLADVDSRLTNALTQPITPRPVYNRIGAPDLTSNAPDQNWNQPLALLVRSARILRESITDQYFQRKFKGLAFTASEYASAMDVFGDVIVKSPSKRNAQNQLWDLDEILKTQCTARDKCHSVWNLIQGHSQ